jgi:hypothetical protein
MASDGPQGGEPNDRESVDPQDIGRRLAGEWCPPANLSRMRRRLKCCRRCKCPLGERVKFNGHPAVRFGNYIIVQRTTGFCASCGSREPSRPRDDPSPEA